jgi:pSer/pThr/pTyr-binding forkhead associated (FHA) protein
MTRTRILTYVKECPNCGYRNREGVFFCEDCAQPLNSATSETVRKSELHPSALQLRENLGLKRTEQFGRDTYLVLNIRNQAEPVIMQVGSQPVTLGRYDARREQQVDIDLTPYRALANGVSRLHAAFYRGASDTLYLVDKNSTNGTYLNQQRLSPNHPVLVQNSDEIMLGNLQIHIYFENLALTPAQSSS